MPKVTLKVPQRNGFSKSFKHLLTAKVGTLVPVLVDELPASSPIDLRVALQAQLPPLATDTFMRLNIKLEAFFVPHRLLYGGFTSWMTQEEFRQPTTPGTLLYSKIPRLRVPITQGTPIVQSGTLMDYLGFKSTTAVSGQSGLAYFNIFPLLAYHRIYDDWYRNANVQTPVFTPPSFDSQRTAQLYYDLYNLPFVKFDTSSNTIFSFETSDQFADGIALGDLRQRNFGYDYFTNALPSPQRGSAKSVQIDTNTNTFTIAALRAANSAQQFSERNMLASPRWQDYLKANYGSNLSDGVAQRSIYLGSGEVNVYNKSVYQTQYSAAVPPLTPLTAQNPFSGSGSQPYGQGTKYGDAQANGAIDLCHEFVTQEPGFLMVFASLVPVVAYSNGIDRMWFRFNDDNAQSDMATPILQNVGNQPIYKGELTGEPNTNVFGYTDRYADFKYKNDQLSGLVREGESLGAFASQRFVVGSPEIGSQFLQIPTNYLDNITVVPAWLSDFGYWLDIFFDYRVAMPLSEYSIPSLQDPAFEHGIDVDIQTNGSRIE